MKIKTALTVLAAATAVFAQGAFAQASSPSRADVKAETKALEKSGKLEPAGEAGDAKAPDTKSTLTRAERKDATKAAVKGKQTTAAGEAADSKAPDTKSTLTRAERKDATKAAVKAKQTTPPGQEGAETKK